MELYKKGLISYEDALGRSTHVEELVQMMQKSAPAMKKGA
jgi:Tfp pilus assembly ATPase PilU